MQNAKDSFYIALRNRLAVMNPARLMEVRGVQRPSVLVEEAEAPMKELPHDTFVLRWTAQTAFENMPTRLMQMACEFHYSTCGSKTNSGLDRGRAMAEMDRELLDLLAPMCTPKLNYATTPATVMQTAVFWGEPIMAPMQTLRDDVSRVLTVQVFAFEEPGEA